MNLAQNIEQNNTNIDSYKPSSQLLQEDKFWKIIQTSFDNSKGNFEHQQIELKKEIKKLSLQDIILFDNKFRQLRGQAYNWQLWAAIYIIHGGCSDDSFIDFRDWLICQGKKMYQKALTNPATLIDIEEEIIEVDWEGIGYIASQIFEEKTGQDIPSTFQENLTITGETWSELGDDLSNMFPKLYAKFSGSN